MPRFSVVIPVYNKANYIAKTIESVCAQTFDDFELVIVNDCSTDNSIEIAKGFSDTRIKILEHEKNKGLSGSRNTGINNTSAQYIAFLDADDLWKPEFLERLDFLIKEYSQASLFASNYEISLKNGKQISHSFDITNGQEHAIISNFFESNLTQTTYIPSGLCVDRKVFETIGLYNEVVTYSEDVDFNIRAHAEFKMAYYNKPLVVYTLESENQITQNSIKGKIVPDYDYYEGLFKERKDIKKYIDFQRYIKAKLFKLSNDRETYNRLVAKIDSNNLTMKQRFLLHLPKTILLGVTKFKLWLQRIGIEVNSY